MKNFFKFLNYAQSNTASSQNIKPGLISLFKGFNNHPEKLISHSAVRTGLFNCPEFAPSEYHKLEEKTIQESEKIIAECCSPNRKRKVVEIFDDLSNTLCKAADASEYIRQANISPEFTEIAESISLKIGGFVEKLNTDRALYNVLNEVVRDGDHVVPMTSVDKHVAKLFLFDFEQSGIHLSEAHRSSVARLNNELLSLGQQFSKYARDPSLIHEDDVPRELQYFYNHDLSNGKIVVSDFSPNIHHAYMREVAYKVFYRDDRQAELCLSNLLSERHRMATLCGFKSFSHRTLRGSLASTPEVVDTFLREIANEIKEDAKTEFTELHTIKKSLEGNIEARLEMWDVPFLSKKRRVAFSAAHVPADLPVYFSLGSVMQGLSDLFARLFGISLALEEATLIDVGTGDVYKLAVLKDEELLGHIYCDFFQRNGKNMQDCHFTIRVGKLLSDGTYQNPIVAVCLNFLPHSDDHPSLLSLSMIDTLFHEMGHAIHTFLARTPYQHVSGTRCCTDMAEVPSLLMEMFASDPRVLHRISSHLSTGQRLPESALRAAIASKNVCGTIDTQQQVFYSMVDQRFHGAKRWGQTINTTRVLADVQQHYYGIPHVPNTSWQLRFSHLDGYGARYYSYLMSRAVVALIWQAYFEENPFNSDAGNQLDKSFLRYGGGIPAYDLVSQYLGREITPVSLARSLVKDLRENTKLIYDVGRQN